MFVEEARYSIYEIIDSSIYDYRQNVSQKDNINKFISEISYFCFDHCVVLEKSKSKNSSFVLNKNEEECIRNCAKLKIDFKDIQIDFYKKLLLE